MITYKKQFSKQIQYRSDYNGRVELREFANVRVVNVDILYTSLCCDVHNTKMQYG